MPMHLLHNSRGLTQKITMVDKKLPVEAQIAPGRDKNTAITTTNTGDTRYQRWYMLIGFSLLDSWELSKNDRSKYQTTSNQFLCG